METRTFQQGLAVMRKLIHGSKTNIIARMAGVSVQTVRDAITSNKQSYAELTPGQQRVIDCATDYIDTCTRKEARLIETTKIN